MNRRNFLIETNGYVMTCVAFALPLSGVAAVTPADGELLPFDANSMAALRKAHAGKPFVLAFWSVYCEPCRDEMAEWDAVKRKHPSLPMELVSTDAPADRALIDIFFKKYPPGPVRKWVFADVFSERVRYAVDRSWRGELPKSYFFDAAHRVEIKNGKVDRTWIESWLTRQASR